MIERLRAFWRSTPVKTKFFAITVPVATIVCAIIFSFLQNKYYDEEYEKLSFTQKKVTISYALLLADPLRQGDQRMVRRLLSTIIADPSFVSASTMNATGRTETKVGVENRKVDEKFVVEEPITYIHHAGVKVEFGRLRTVVSDHLIHQALRKRSKVLPVALLGMLAGLFLAVQIAYRWAIGKPLSSMVNSIEEARRAENPIKISWLPRDETGRLAAAFNDHIEREWSYKKQLIEANAELESRISLRTRELSEALQRANEARREVTRLAMQDPLTGLPNRRQFVQRLEQTLAHARRQSGNSGVGLMMIDLDRFKNVNDTCGHGAGDQLLINVARRLRNAVPQDALVSRLGGDEFAVIINDYTSSDMLTRLAASVVNTLNRPITVSDMELYSGASVGISVFPADGDTGEKLIANADMALFRAKDAGRGRYVLYNEEMREAADRADKIESELRKAIDGDLLDLHYQPKIEVATGRIIGYEALLRWHHKTLGTISPGTFFPIAEECGLILDLGRTVFKRAVRDLRMLLDIGVDPGTIAINLHPVELRRRGHLTEFVKLVEQQGWSLDRFVLEINENSVVGRGNEETVAILSDLQQRGLAISLDDFGTGYASLRQLIDMPFDEIKIDRSFITNMTTDHGSQAIVRATIDLAASLNASVVAEGIETFEQLEMLAGFGAVVGQGFLLGRPMPLRDVVEFHPRNRNDAPSLDLAQSA